MSHPTAPQSILGRLTLAVAVSLIAACVQVPKEDRLLNSGADGSARGTLDPASLRVLSWNIHKATDADLPDDLARQAKANDVLLLQEAVPSQPVLDALKQAGHVWQMVGAFSVRGVDRGVLVTARVAPVDQKALRTFEPLLPLPKSAIITHYRLLGRRETLVVANLHGINFSLGTGRFQEQLEDVAGDLMHHRGPIIFGGDFNTWSRKRHEVLHEVMQRLGLVDVEPVPDERRVAFGRHLDHLFVRGFTIVEASTTHVKSSDHNPILVRLSAPVAKR